VTWLPFCPIVVPFLPPTGNHIRVVNWKRKMQFLTKEAHAFQRDFIDCVVRNPAVQTALPELDRSLPWEVCYFFYFPLEDLVNTTFGQKGGAKSRYKKMDSENRIKLVSDCLALALDIDDSQFFDGAHRKRSAAMVDGQPQIHIWMRPLALDDVGL